METKLYDVIIIGAGTSGLFCAYLSDLKGLNVAIIDHNLEVGKKLALAGGGMGNMTNRHLSPEHYVSNSKEKNRLLQNLFKNFNCADILSLLEHFDIPYEERDFGQIFCLKPVKKFIEKIADACVNVDFFLGKQPKSVFYDNSPENNLNKSYHVLYDDKKLMAPQLVIATGSIAYPQVGGSDFGLRLANKWGHQVYNFEPALVPLKLQKSEHNQTENFPSLLNLEGISVEARIKVIKHDKKYFDPCEIRSLLFTHQGLSGPAILVASCNWESGNILEIDFLPKHDLLELMHQVENGKKYLKNLLLPLLPDRLVYRLLPEELQNRKVAELGKQQRQLICRNFHNYICVPEASLGFKKAEAAKGGINIDEISFNFESKKHKNLFFCGEILDITGLLGGYNIHFALGSAKMLAKSLKKF